MNELTNRLIWADGPNCMWVIYYPVELYVHILSLCVHDFSLINNHYFYTVAINELLCMKNAGAQMAMDFS